MEDSKKLTHFDSKGQAIMVDISNKNHSEREAIAVSKIYLSKETMGLIKDNKVSKGDVLGVARVAAIMASKETYRLIPMCHQLLLTSSKVDFDINREGLFIEIKTTVKTNGKTGVEMEALTAATVAALTIYDMCKAIDKRMVIGETYLLKKTGGKSGSFNFNDYH